MKEQLEGEVNHLTQLLQDALRKQDEMALEAADAWQKVREDNKTSTEEDLKYLFALLLRLLAFNFNFCPLSGTG